MQAEVWQLITSVVATFLTKICTREPFVAAKSAVQHLCEAVNAHCDITTTHLGEEADRLLPHVKNTLFREGICIDMEERTIVEPWEPNEGSMRLFQRYEEAAEV